MKEVNIATSYQPRKPRGERPQSNDIDILTENRAMQC